MCRIPTSTLGRSIYGNEEIATYAGDGSKEHTETATRVRNQKIDDDREYTK